MLRYVCRIHTSTAPLSLVYDAHVRDESPGLRYLSRFCPVKGSGPEPEYRMAKGISVSSEFVAVRKPTQSSSFEQAKCIAVTELKT